MNPLLQDFSAITNMPPWLLAIILTWTLAWKGLALWKAAKKNSSLWFVVLLVINTIGILEILYYFLFSEMKFDNKKDAKGKKGKKKASRIAPRRDLSKQKAFIDQEN
ncbi:MAG: DUF5652 family protein [Candidatus Pacearchaeota archaeon]